MSDESRIDTASLRRGGEGLGQAVGDLSSQLQTLTGNAPAWGEDDISQLCKMVYDAIVDVITESGGAVGETWQQHSDNLSAAADAYEATEAANTDAASAMIKEA